MNRPYSAYSPYSTTPTERLHSFGPAEPGGAGATVDELGYQRYGNDDDYADYDAEFDEYGEYGDGVIDRRWVWVAGVAGVILLVAVICTVVILGGGDSGSVSANVSPSQSQPATTSAAPPAASTTQAAPPAAALPPETLTTVTPSPTAAQQTAPPAVAAPAPSLRAVTYRVTGSRQLIDLVTVIYTDQQGALQTDVNVALPWAKTVVLDPGVELSSVTATSVAGQLNCSITDGGGAILAEQATNSLIATCTK